ncbi:hypothetical protein HYFRA_00001257 [Hymenoscyphus fraxineus]|uniref:C2H2-type domain-containing protein n=1 Tax=Hymenoscyphus fraxineus TaxID=746836 RepID=A0A9N9PM92_9HELO|nr:hypothetical protein HYFRA_00001257 [Hymenoscyphus fraxineus]
MQSYSHHENSANWNMEGEENLAFSPQPRPQGAPGGAEAGNGSGICHQSIVGPYFSITDNHNHGLDGSSTYGYVSNTFSPSQFAGITYDIANPTTYQPQFVQDAFANPGTSSINVDSMELSGAIDNQIAFHQPYPQVDFNQAQAFELQPAAPYTNLQFDYNGVPLFALQSTAPQADLLDINTQPIIPICTHCYMIFSRDADRARHEQSVHSPATFICPVTTCPKHTGRPYSRQDKLTEHLWKKHANLGYTKRT